MMICCEENEPYGPPAATAAMFLELLCTAHEQRCKDDICSAKEVAAADDGTSSNDSTNLTSICYED